jgi:hypothetical protein
MEKVKSANSGNMFLEKEDSCVDYSKKENAP